MWLVAEEDIEKGCEIDTTYLPTTAAGAFADEGK